MNKPNISSSSLRTLNILNLLRGHSLTGLSNGELAKALDESPANINRALNTLIAAGFVQKLDNGRFAHHIKMLQIAQAHANEMHNAQNKINEINQRILAGSNF